MKKFFILSCFALILASCVTGQKPKNDPVGKNAEEAERTEEPIAFSKPRLTSGKARNATITNAYGYTMRVVVNGADAGSIPTGSSAGLIIDGLAKTGSAVSLDFIKVGGATPRIYKSDIALYAEGGYQADIRIPAEDETLAVSASGIVDASFLVLSYPLEAPDLSVSATVKNGNRPMAALSPGFPPVSVLMPKKAIALTIEYRYSQGDGSRYYLSVPQSDSSIDDFIVIAQKNASFEIPRLAAVTKARYARESDSSGLLTVINKYPILNVGISITGGQESWQRVDIAEATGTGVSGLAPMGETTYRIAPGSYTIFITKLLRSSDMLATYPLDVRAGERKILVLGDEKAVVQPEDVSKIIPNIIEQAQLRSNVPGAVLTISVHSNDGGIKRKEEVGGVFLLDGGALKARALPESLFADITARNAAGFNVTFTASADGYLSDSFTIPVASLLKGGSAVLTRKFELLRQGAPGSLTIFEGAELIE